MMTQFSNKGGPVTSSCPIFASTIVPTLNLNFENNAGFSYGLLRLVMKCVLPLGTLADDEIAVSIAKRVLSI